jgi:hypothetical protein
VKSVVALGADDLGHDDLEANLIEVSEWACAQSGEVCSDPTPFVLPADAFRDKNMLEWILSNKSAEDTTHDDFNDLMVTRFEATEPIKGLAALEVGSTGFANQHLPDQIMDSIDNEDQVTEANLIEMQSRYGKDNLD